MKFGVREICDVVLKAKATQKVGNKTFYKHEPVIYFDTLKTSSMEGAATTVYAQGGRGNARLMAWEGERTVTFTMEDALISPEGFMILSGAGLIEAGGETTIKQHATQTVAAKDTNYTAASGNATAELVIPVDYRPYSDTDGDYIYVFMMKDGDMISEPFIGSRAYLTREKKEEAWKVGTVPMTTPTGDELAVENETEIATAIKDGLATWAVKVADMEVTDRLQKAYTATHLKDYYTEKTVSNTATYIANFDAVLIDYYVERKSGAKQIEITADKFGGNYYLEASTLFRNQAGVDMPAEFIIPNCKVQSNFNFTMASSGDPSTFTFTMDAFPDYTRFDPTKKVLAAIQIIEDTTEGAGEVRSKTWEGTFSI